MAGDTGNATGGGGHHWDSHSGGNGNAHDHDRCNGAMGLEGKTQK